MTDMAMSDDGFPLVELQEPFWPPDRVNLWGNRATPSKPGAFDQKHYFAVVTVKGKLGPEWASDFAERLRAAASEAGDFDEWTMADDLRTGLATSDQ